MDFKLHNGSGSLCCKSCGRQDKQLNTYDWLADIPGNGEESDLVEVQFKNISAIATIYLLKRATSWP